MSLLKIDISDMRAIAEHWRTTARPDFAHPFLAGIPPMLDAWAEDAKGLSELKADTAEVKALRTKARALDAEHDDRLAAIHTYLTGLAALHANEAAVLAVRDTLLPEGRRMQQRSYQAQGVAVAEAKAKLDDGLRAQLADLNAPTVDLEAAVDAWIAAGAELQRVDAERASIEGQRSKLRNDLRMRWLKMHRAMVQGAELSDLSEAARARLFSKVAEAS